MTTSPAFTVNCSILLTDLPLLERPRAVRQAGFDAIEFWWPFASAVPADHEVTAFIRSIEDAGVQLTGLNFAAGDMPAGDRGILSNPTHSSEFRDNVAVAIEIAQSLGTKAFNALYGNRSDDFSPEQQDETAAENLAYTGEAANRIGAVVLVEAVSGAERYPLKHAADAVAVIDRVEEAYGTDNLRLLADLYHLEVNGDDIPAALDVHADRIGHVQIADNPGRGEPGTGTLDLRRYLDQLHSNGYAGYVGLEYKPTHQNTFDWLDRDLRPSRRGVVI
ncbi:hydroxypyruvate isomerase family protein [Rhodococcus sp. ACPA1]|uniref:hydroxypyruvate isomerase family protein n=1 Tax=Rhodococcus sp. ACPA1 TaxID=2028572 RepID=UPI000BB1027F|nr:TIM barrel protein [Rhodococcus sp. ACPA1]PBC47154.1 hydroxypyruvate isomerase [Rhodococcus sp. ACPA1]